MERERQVSGQDANGREARRREGERGKREKSGFIGMHGFGGSAPADVLYEHFEITPEATVAKVKALLGGSIRSGILPE